MNKQMAEFRATSVEACAASSPSCAVAVAHHLQADQAAEADETASAAVHAQDRENDAAHDHLGAGVGVVHFEAATVPHGEPGR